MSVFSTSIYFFLSISLQCSRKKADEKKQTRKINRCIFLVCFSHLPSYGYIGEKQTRKTDKEKKKLFIFLVCFSHLPCYGYIGEKQTRITHLFIFIVCFFHLPCPRISFSGGGEASCRLRSRMVKTDKKKKCCQSISPTFLQVHWEIQTREIYVFVFLVCNSHLPSFWYIEKNRQEIKRGGKNIPIYLSCLFFLICLLTATLEKNRQEKQTRKKTYLYFLSVFLICLATATLEKNRQEKKHLFIFLVCFSHLPCYGYI